MGRSKEGKSDDIWEITGLPLSLSGGSAAGATTDYRRRCSRGAKQRDDIEQQVATSLDEGEKKAARSSGTPKQQPDRTGGGGEWAR